MQPPHYRPKFERRNARQELTEQKGRDGTAAEREQASRKEVKEQQHAATPYSPD